MTTLQLDYSLHTYEERNNLLQKLLSEIDTSELSPLYIDKVLTPYLLSVAMDKKERLNKFITTDNRSLTINKHETSYEGLCGKLENGEDGIYNMMSDLGKNTILTPKDPVTDADIASIPYLQEIQDIITSLEAQAQRAYGRKRHLLNKQVKEMRQDKYVVRNDARGTGWKRFSSSSGSVRALARLDLYDSYSFDEDGNPINNGIISLFNPSHIEALLCNYSGLKENAYSRFEYDLWYLMEDLDNLIESTLREDYPLYYDLLIYKIDGKTNAEIQALLEEKHGICHSIEYISSLWRNKIPKLLADNAQKQYLIWYYTYKERGQWKKCSRCGQIKLAHNKFFSKNKSSKDGWYSLCKDCRNANSKKNLKRQLAKEKYLQSKED